MLGPLAARDVLVVACGGAEEGLATIPARCGGRDGKARVLDVQPVAAGRELRRQVLQIRPGAR